MGDSPGEPVTTGFEELLLVQACLFFDPAGAGGDGGDRVDEFPFSPIGITEPLDVAQAVFEVDGARLAVEAEAVPVPELEGKDVGGGADLEHHGARARAVRGTGRDEEVIVPAGGNPVDVLLHGKGAVSGLAARQVSRHGGGIDAGLQAEIDDRVRGRVEQIVALVLGEGHVEVLADVLGERVHLEGEIAAAHGVEEIEADGKVEAKAGMDGFAHEGLGMQEHHVGRGNFKAEIAEAKQQAVFFGNTIEAPRVVGGVSGEIERFAHPLPAPWAGIKERNQTQGRVHGTIEGVAKDLARKQLRSVGNIGVEHPVHARQQGLLEAIGGAPVQEEGSLVLLRRRRRQIVEPEIADTPGTLSCLDLPASHVGVDQAVGIGCEQGSPGSEDEDGPRGAAHAELDRLRQRLVEEVADVCRADASEDGVLGEVGGKLGFDRVGWAIGLLSVNDREAGKKAGEGGFDLGEEGTGVALDADGARVAGCDVGHDSVPAGDADVGGEA